MPAMMMVIMVQMLVTRQSNGDPGQKLVDGRESQMAEVRSDVHDGRWQASPTELIVAVTVSVADLREAVTVSTVVAMSMSVSVPSVIMMSMIVVGGRRPETSGGYSWGHLRERAGSNGRDGRTGLQCPLVAERVGRQGGACDQRNCECGLHGHPVA